MRPVRVEVVFPITGTNLGLSPWVPLSYLTDPFAVGLGAMISAAATGVSYTVQHTFDDLDQTLLQRGVQVSRAATVATVFDNGLFGNGHGLVVGDSVIIRGTGSAVLDSPKSTAIPGVGGGGDYGWTVASVTDANHYTYTVANSGPAADAGATTATSLRVYNHATLAAAATRLDGYYAFPVTAIRLNVATLTAGAVALDILQGIGYSR
jgi:hypothetical protein